MQPLEVMALLNVTVKIQETNNAALNKYESLTTWEPRNGLHIPLSINRFLAHTSISPNLDRSCQLGDQERLIR
jgi:hypothetical protein